MPLAAFSSAAKPRPIETPRRNPEPLFPAALTPPVIMRMKKAVTWRARALRNAPVFSSARPS